MTQASDSTKQHLSTEEVSSKLNKIVDSWSSQEIFNKCCIKTTVPDTELFTYFMSKEAYTWISDFHFFNPSMRHLLDEPFGTFSNFSFYKIYEFASYFLSHEWEALDFTSINISETTLKRIEDEIYPVKLRRKSTDLERADLEARGLGLLIYRVSYEFAFKAKWSLENAFNDKDEILSRLHKASFFIIPATSKPMHFHQFAISIKLDDPQIDKRCIFLQMETRPINQVYMEIKSFDFALSKEKAGVFGSFGYNLKTEDKEELIVTSFPSISQLTPS